MKLFTYFLLTFLVMGVDINQQCQINDLKRDVAWNDRQATRNAEQQWRTVTRLNNGWTELQSELIEIYNRLDNLYRKTTVYYGWYSKEASTSVGGVSLYSTPDGKGVLGVTAIFEEGKEDAYRWADKVCVGRVSNFITNVVPFKVQLRIGTRSGER